MFFPTKCRVLQHADFMEPFKSIVLSRLPDDCIITSWRWPEYFCVDPTEKYLVVEITLPRNGFSKKPIRVKFSEDFKDCEVLNPLLRVEERRMPKQGEVWIYSRTKFIQESRLMCQSRSSNTQMVVDLKGEIAWYGAWAEWARSCQAEFAYESLEKYYRSCLAAEL